MNLAFLSDVVFYCVKLCVGFGEKVCTSVVGNDGFFFFFFAAFASENFPVRGNDLV